MARFNKKNPTNTVKTYEGASAYRADSATNWLNFLLGSFISNAYYEDEDSRMTRFNELTDEMIDQYGIPFVEKASWFARNVCGMRTASQMVAANLNSKHFDGKREFYHNFVKRPDDISEILALLDSRGEKRSHALVRGFGDALSEMSDYQLGKYKMSNHEFSLVDCVNVCHPKATDGLTKLMNGTLETPTTWETSISASSSDADKANRWYQLVVTNQLGYNALVKNQNNILWAANYFDTNGNVQTAHELLAEDVRQLTNKVAIHKSLIFPYQIWTAYHNLKIRNTSVIQALEKAFSISLGNMPELGGKTLIALDVSGSMNSPISEKSTVSIKEAGAVYAVAFYLASKKVSLVKFGSKAKMTDYSRLDSPFTLIERFAENDNLGYGTNVPLALDIIEQDKYDRIIFVSDEQTLESGSGYGGYWWSRDERSKNTNPVKKRILDIIDKHGTQFWSFNLSTYDRTIFNPYSPNTHSITSLSPIIFKLMPLIESGETSIVRYINDADYTN